MSDYTNTRRSLTWDYYTKLDAGKAQCDICTKIVSYKTSTTNLKSHIARKHPDIDLPHLTYLKQRHHPIKKKLFGISGTDPQDEEPYVLVLEAASVERASNENYVFSDKVEMDDFYLQTSNNNKVKINNLLVKMFVTDFQASSFVDNKSFREFVYALNPSYELPLSKEISEVLIPSFYQKCVEHAKTICSTADKLCLTVNLWNSVCNETFVAVSAHFIDDNLKSNNILLECKKIEGSITPITLADNLKTIITQWDIGNKILVVVTDNTTNIVSAVKDHLKLKHLSCFAHTLNYIVGNALYSDEILIILKKVKKIASHFKKSSIAASKLNQFQKMFGHEITWKLMQDNMSKWHLTYLMLEQFITLENPISEAVAVLNVNLPILNVEEWLTIKQLCNVLKPFYKVIEIIDGEKCVTASLIIVLANGLIDVCQNANKQIGVLESVTKVITTLQESLKQRLGRVELHEILNVATFVDPRFKNLPFQSHNMANVQNEVLSLINQFRTNNDKALVSSNLDNEENSPWQLFDKSASTFIKTNTNNSKASLEIQRYLNDELLPRTEDPFKWWQDNKINYPYLSQVVKSNFCALATSIFCEQLPSSARLILEERQDQLSALEVQHLLSLHVNSMLFD